MQDICQIGKQKGFDVVIILQPFLGTGSKELTEHEKMQYNIFDQASVVQGYQFFADELDVLSNNCTITSDLRDVFNGFKEPVYFDTAHIGPIHNKVIADKIFELIHPLI